MTTLWRTLALLVLLTTSATTFAVARPADFTGAVVGVHDGDTLTVLTSDKRQIRIRLAEIDAPEIGQPWGSKAKDLLSQMVYRRSVLIRPQEIDRYGRLVAHAYVGEKQVNAELVRAGGAWAYRQYLRDMRLISMEQEARRGRRGLWGLPSDQTVPPWDWRASKRKPTPAAPAQKAPRPARTETLTRRDYPPKGSAQGGVACGSKRYCREMTSCAEANSYLRQCGLSRLDGDGDGVPCEAICI